jgi:LysM repeat protein
MKKALILFFAAAGFFAFSSGASAQHYVTAGETMYSISRDHEMSLKDLISLNPHIKDPNKIRPNDYIVIRSNVEKQKDLVDYAKSLDSVTAYVYGGQEFPYKTDCSGFAQGVFKKFGVNLPRVSKDQAKTGKPVKFTELQVGDLMFFSTRADKVISHVGIYMGDEMFISNLNETKDVEIMPIWGSWSRQFFMWGARHEL